MDLRDRTSRRLFVLSGATLAASRAFAQSKTENVYRFATPKWDVLLTVEFYDYYASKGFWFDERRANCRYCLSAKGEEDRNCVANFSGSLAVARYQVRARSQAAHLAVLREHVRTIDQDDRLKARAPFDRVIELRQGVASDIQAFGYQLEASSRIQKLPRERYGPWCLLRQDLYFDGQSSPFLVVHWKHALSAIRILDIIPGDETRTVER
jgi:hypothetical protein